MGFTIDVSSALAISAQLKDIRANKIPQAKQRALIALKRRAPVEARREIQQEYNLPASRITQGLSTTSDADSVSVTASGKGIGLISFGAKWNGPRSSGVTVQILKGKQDTIAGAFIRSPGGNTAGTGPQVFKRAGKARYPINRLFGPSIADGLRRVEKQPDLADFAQQVLSAEISRVIAL